MMFIAESFFGGCISKVINDGKDYSWTKIKSVINDKNNCNLSAKIYRVIENALNIVTDKKFKGTDILYEAIEKIYIEFREYGSTIESVKCGLGMLNSDVTVEKCENFLEKFYEGICQDGDLHNIISLILQEKGIDINQKEFQQLNKTVEYGFDQLNRKIDNLADSTVGNSSINDENKTENKTKFQNNKKQDYIKNWNSRLFLHLDNKENPLTLADTFIMPDYIYKRVDDLEYDKDDTLDKVIDNYVLYDKTSTMFIIGAPGMGKSSITSWIANRYKENDQVIILRFRDWKRDELENGLLLAICNTLNCKQNDLEAKLLIIDGFDEIKLLDKRMRLLNTFYNDIKDFENLKCIITSRPGYVNTQNFQNIIQLESFDIIKIKKFYEKIVGDELIETEKIKFNLDVLGIPVILYMAIMSKVNIDENPTKPELYDHIFAKKGGIFDKFSDGKTEYSSGSQVLRNPDNIEKYLIFLSEIGFKMFQKGDLFLESQEYQVPELEFQGKLVNIMEFPIKYLFEETENNIEFVHKSIYEYFVSEYFLKVISNGIDTAKTKDELACILGNWMINKINISVEIRDFLEYKIGKYLKRKFDFVSETFELMLKDGMTYYTGKRYKNVVDFEIKVFINMLDFLHMWETTWSNTNLLSGSCLLKNNREPYLNLTNFNLKELDLREVDLRNADLRNADLSNANLKRANLANVDLRYANLSGANLEGAILYRANLSKAILENSILVGANLTEANLTGAYLVRATLNGATFIEAKLINVDLVMSTLEGSNFTKADLSKSDLRGLDLRKVNLSRANLSEANLSRANLNREVLKEIKQVGTNFDYATFT